MEEDLNLFFADELRGRQLTDEQSAILQDVLFPAWDDTPKSLTEAAMDMALAYDKWKKGRKEHDGKTSMMSDEEIDSLANSMF